MEDAFGAVFTALFVYGYFNILANFGDYFVVTYDDGGRISGYTFNSRPIVEGVAQIALLGARAGADVRYDAVVYDPRSGAFSVEGLSVTAPDGAFDLAAARLSSVDAGDSVVDLRIAFEGLSVDPSSLDLPPEVAVQVSMLGLDTLTANGEIEIAYDLRDSGAEIVAAFDLDALGQVNLAVELAGLHLEQERFDPEPRGDLVGAALSIENDGLFEIAQTIPGVPPIDGSTASQLAGMASGQALAFLAGADVDPTVDLSQAPEEARRLASEIQGAVAGFLFNQDRISLTLAPAEPVSLQELEALEDVAFDPSARIAAVALLNPRVTIAPVNRRPIVIDPADGSLDLETRARALIDGVGAPRDLSAAIDLLLSDDAPEARVLLAEALLARGADADFANAYQAALSAEADDAPGAGALASVIAADLPLETLLGVEAALFDEADLAEERAAALDAGDAAQMRGIAQSYELGVDAPRNALEAYRWALLAAAAGDAVAADMRDRVAARFAFASPAEQTRWEDALAVIAAEASAAWAEGLGATVAAAQR